MERRLAAVLAADLVGYSRLVRADEEGTVTALKKLYETVIAPIISRHHGRVVKLMGDGMLAEFASAVDCIRSAVEMQDGIAGEAATAADGEPYRFRIGINLGDLIIDGDDIQGDGVNVAARLEGLADPGGICISGAMFDQVRDRVDVEFEGLGALELKNISRPVDVWRWCGTPTTQSPAPPVQDAVPLDLPDKPSIAVLPFDNMSDDPDQEFFADGMAEDIITALSRMPWFFVIARNSSFTYKGRAVDVKQVSAELGVKYVLEGSVRKAGNRLRITAQLIDATTGQHAWAERYDRELYDIFEVQDEVTKAIVGAVAPEFLSIETKKLRRKDPARLDAWECVMRGRAHVWKLGKEDAAEARKLFERAIQLSPGGEFGAGDLALVHFLESYYRWSDSPEQSLKDMLQAAEAAVAADDNDPWALTVLAWAYNFTHRWDEALETIERAVQQSPNFAAAIGVRGTILALVGECERAIEDVQEALRLSPRDSMIGFWMMGLFWAYHASQRYEEAVATAQKSIRIAPNNPTFRRQLAAAYAWLDRPAEARQAVADYLQLEPSHTLADAAKVPSRIAEHVGRFVEGLRRAGLPE